MILFIVYMINVLLVMTHLCKMIVPYTFLTLLFEGWASSLSVFDRESRLKMYGNISFSVSASNAWHSLPLEIRTCSTVDSFKKSLKEIIKDTFVQTVIDCIMLSLWLSLFDTLLGPKPFMWEPRLFTWLQWTHGTPCFKSSLLFYHCYFITKSVNYS